MLAASGILMRSSTLHRVLNRRSGQEKSVTTVEIQQDIPPRTRATFDGLGLVEDHVLPLEAFQVHTVRHDEVVTCDDNVEWRIAVVHDCLFGPELAKGFSICDRTPVRNDLERWHKPSELLLPVVQC